MADTVRRVALRTIEAGEYGEGSMALVSQYWPRRRVVKTCALCNEALGADRIAIVAPPIADYVHAACLGPARALIAQLRLDEGEMLVSGNGSKTGSPSPTMRPRA